MRVFGPAVLIGWILCWISLALAMTRRRRLELREEVREMFYHAWNGYLEHGFPADEVKPISCQPRTRNYGNPGDLGTNDVLGDYSLTLVDAMDTLVFLGDQQGFQNAVELALQHLRFSQNENVVQVFEVNIRVLGGLLSAHLLAIEPRFQMNTSGWYKNQLLDLAHDLGKRLLPAFKLSPTGIPFARVNLKHGVPIGTPTKTCTAGAGTLILEFAVLSRLTGDPEFENYAKAALQELWNRRSRFDLVGNEIDVVTGRWTVPGESGIGAGIDSFYEYLLKAYVLLGDEEYWNIFDASYQAVMKHIRQDLFFHPTEMHSRNTLAFWIDSLSAFFAGLQVLRGDIGEAIKLHETYFRIWRKYGGLPERWDTRLMAVNLPHYPLRPELIESTYLLYQATGNPYYLQVGEIFVRNFQNITRQRCGFASIRNVETRDLDDRMESFFLSETLKYLFLLFDAENRLHEWFGNHVWNTEAHLLFIPRFKSPKSKTTNFAVCNRPLPAFPGLLIRSPLRNESLAKIYAAVGLNFERTSVCPRSERRDIQVVFDLEQVIGSKLLPTSYRTLSSLDVLSTSLHGLQIGMKKESDNSLTVVGVNNVALPPGKSLLVLEKDVQVFNMGRPYIDPKGDVVVLRIYCNMVEGVSDTDGFWDTHEYHLWQEGQKQTLLTEDCIYEDIAAVRARFGPDFLVDPGVRHYPFQTSLAFIPENSLGCEAYSPAAAARVRGQTVLVMRGECLFSDKVLQAQKAGAVMVIIVNTEEGSFEMLPAEGVPNSAYRIPSLSVGYTDGLRILRSFALGLIGEIVATPLWYLEGLQDVTREERSVLSYGNLKINNLLLIDHQEHHRVLALDAKRTSKISYPFYRKVLHAGMSFGCLRRCLPVLASRDGVRWMCCAK